MVPPFLSVGRYGFGAAMSLSFRPTVAATRSTVARKPWTLHKKPGETGVRGHRILEDSRRSSNDLSPVRHEEPGGCGGLPQVLFRAVGARATPTRLPQRRF